MADAPNINKAPTKYGIIVFLYSAFSDALPIIYLIPNTKSTTTATIGFLLFYLPFSALGMVMVGIIIAAAFALVGFLIGTMKMPNIAKFKFTQKTGREFIKKVKEKRVATYNPKLHKKRVFEINKMVEKARKMKAVCCV